MLPSPEPQQRRPPKLRVRARPGRLGQQRDVGVSLQSWVPPRSREPRRIQIYLCCCSKETLLMQTSWDTGHSRFTLSFLSVAVTSLLCTVRTFSACLPHVLTGEGFVRVTVLSNSVTARHDCCSLRSMYDSHLDTSFAFSHSCFLVHLYVQIHIKHLLKERTQI